MISKRNQLWVLAFFINLKCITASETYKSIMWDPQNPLFVEGMSNCDPAYKHKLLKIRATSKIKFICPNVATVLQTTTSEVSKSNKYENLWLLYDRTSFDKCDTKLNATNMKQPLLHCTDPTGLKFHSITFQKFAAEPNELTFQKGRSYFFIATSNGLISHINDTSGGHCNDTANKVYMKIEVYVCNDTDQGKDENCTPDDIVGDLICPKELSVAPSTTPTSASLDLDDVCKSDDVGELICPKELNVASSTTPTPTPSSAPVTVSSSPSGDAVIHTVIHTTTTTVTTTVTATVTVPIAGTEGGKGKRTGELTGDSDTGNEKAWMAATFVFVGICIAFVLGLILFHYYGKKKCRTYEHRVSPELGKKNLAFKHDSLDNKPSVSLQGSLPDKDVVLYNREVFYNNTDNEGKLGNANNGEVHYSTVNESEENKKNAST